MFTFLNLAVQGKELLPANSKPTRVIIDITMTLLKIQALSLIFTIRKIILPVPSDHVVEIAHRFDFRQQ